MADFYRTRDGREVAITPFGLTPDDGPPRGKHYVKPRGYAGIPGTGPADKQCRHCAHYTHAEGTASSYPKCGLIRANWTRGRASDILAKSPACSRFAATHEQGAGE